MLPLADLCCFGAVDPPQGAAISAVDSTIIDTLGYEGVMFIVRLGTASDANTIRVQQDADPTGATMADLPVTILGSATANTLVLTVARPTKRYVRCHVARRMSSTIDGMFGILYGASSLPAVQPMTVAVATHISPEEGPVIEVEARPSG
jgi:hypothetical protein